MSYDTGPFSYDETDMEQDFPGFKHADPNYFNVLFSRTKDPELYRQELKSLNGSTLSYELIAKLFFSLQQRYIDNEEERNIISYNLFNQWIPIVEGGEHPVWNYTLNIRQVSDILRVWFPKAKSLKKLFTYISKAENYERITSEEWDVDISKYEYGGNSLFKDYRFDEVTNEIIYLDKDGSDK